MKRTLLILSLLLVVACTAREAAELDENVVATIDGQPLLRSDLELYLRVNLIEPAGSEVAQADPDQEELDRVKSRLLDALVEERALLAEALRRNVQVSDREIEAYLDMARVEGHGIHELDRDVHRRLARQRLQIQRLLESIALGIEPPAVEEIEAYADQAASLPATGKRVVVRVLMFESEETARSVHAEIIRDRTTFADAALTHETQPGQAAPQTLEWSALPGQVQDALEKLKPGEVSPPLDHNGLIYLVQVQAWLEDGGWSRRERLRVARAELERSRRNAARSALRDEVMEKSAVALQIGNLDFRYLPEAGG